MIAGLLAGWVASAGAGLPPPPLPTLPTLPTVPTLPVLPPAPPPNPPQVPPAPVPRAPAPVPALPSAPHQQLPAGGEGGSTGGDGSGSGSGYTTLGTGSSTTAPQSTTAADRTGRRHARVYRFRFSRDWIARSGPRRRRQTTLIFKLSRPAVVEFVVVQIAPTCRPIGRFRVQGRAGTNRVRFRGRIGRRVLGPGTYRIRARALPGTRIVAAGRLVIVANADREAIASGRGADTCGPPAEHAFAAGTTTAGPGKAQRTESPAQTEEGSGRRPRDQGVLGSRFTQMAVDAAKNIPPALFILLGLGIALLAVAALPLQVAPGARTAELLVHQRPAFAIGGAATLIAVAIAYLLG